MKTQKWTKADAKRAAKMGWRMDYVIFMNGLFERRFIVAEGDRFKSDDEAIDWVVRNYRHGPACNDNTRTCFKALFLCAKG